jgi:hypothetical protein
MDIILISNWNVFMLREIQYLYRTASNTRSIISVNRLISGSPWNNTIVRPVVYIALSSNLHSKVSGGSPTKNQERNCLKQLYQQSKFTHPSDILATSHKADNQKERRGKCLEHREKHTQTRNASVVTVRVALLTLTPLESQPTRLSTNLTAFCTLAATTCSCIAQQV